MLSLINVSKKYKDHVVFSSVTLNMSDPGIYVLQGINGSGKSTILKVIAGIIYKSEGKIDKNVSISYLPDKFSMPKLMKAKSYLYEYLKMVGREKDLDLLISKFQIPNKRIGDLSKGNQQKLGLLQVLSFDSDCYLLDEPLDGLDEFAKHLVKEIIMDKVANGKIVIMSLHGKNLFNDLKPKIFDVKDGFIQEKKRRIKKIEENKEDEKEEL